MNIDKSVLIKISDILSKYIIVFEDLKNYKLPDCIYFNIILMVMNFKYKDTKNLDKTNKIIIKDYGKTFKDYDFLLNDFDYLDNKINEIKEIFDETINSETNLKKILKGKKNQLRGIIKKNYITDITNIKNIADHRTVLTTYYKIFGCII